MTIRTRPTSIHSLETLLWATQLRNCWLGGDGVNHVEAWFYLDLRWTERS